jgi:hypothetical protein
MKFQFSRAFNFGVALVSGIIFGNATIGEILVGMQRLLAAAQPER